MRIIILLALLQTLVLIASCADSKKIQIGIKKRVENCTHRSRKGDTLFLTYVGTLENGEEFDKNTDPEDPFFLRLGIGQVIQGWEQGLIGMCEGEKRKLVIPPELAYGTFGAPPKIPPNATLIFIVELVKLVPEDKSAKRDISQLEEL